VPQDLPPLVKVFQPQTLSNL